MSMDIHNFLVESLPLFYIYMAIALPTMAVTLFAAWFIATIMPLVPVYMDYQRHRFRSYLKDVDFRRAFLVRRMSDRRRSRTMERLVSPVVRVKVWFTSWRAKPPPGLSELDSMPVETVEEGGVRPNEE